MKEYTITELEKEKWKGTLLPVSYTSHYYYDISGKCVNGSANFFFSIGI